MDLQDPFYMWGTLVNEECAMKGKMHIFFKIFNQKDQSIFKNDKSRGIFSFLVTPQLTDNLVNCNFPVKLKVNSSLLVFIVKNFMVTQCQTEIVVTHSCCAGGRDFPSNWLVPRAPESSFNHPPIFHYCGCST